MSFYLSVFFNHTRRGGLYAVVNKIGCRDIENRFRVKGFKRKPLIFQDFFKFLPVVQFLLRRINEGSPYRKGVLQISSFSDAARVIPKHKGSSPNVRPSKS